MVNLVWVKEEMRVDWSGVGEDWCVRKRNWVDCYWFVCGNKIFW